jgi:hypothetical protein
MPAAALSLTLALTIDSLVLVPFRPDSAVLPDRFWTAVSNAASLLASVLYVVALDSSSFCCA